MQQQINLARAAGHNKKYRGQICLIACMFALASERRPLSVS